MAKVQPVFQNPFEAFNPLKKVDRYLAVDRAAASSGLASKADDRGGDGRGAAEGGPEPRRGRAAASRMSCRAGNCSAWRSPGR